MGNVVLQSGERRGQGSPEPAVTGLQATLWSPAHCDTPRHPLPSAAALMLAGSTVTPCRPWQELRRA